MCAYLRARKRPRMRMRGHVRKCVLLNALNRIRIRMRMRMRMRMRGHRRAVLMRAFLMPSCMCVR